MGYARFGSRLARDVVEITHNVECLDKGGFWAVVVTFEGAVTCVRFAEVTDYKCVRSTAHWRTPVAGPGLGAPDWCLE